MEDMFADMTNSWIKIMHFMGVEISEAIPFEGIKAKANHIAKKLGHYQLFSKASISRSYLQKLLDAYSFDKLSEGRRKGMEDQHSHYRKGAAGDWKNYFKAAHKERFKEHYGPLLIKLGYEKDDNW